MFEFPFLAVFLTCLVMTAAYFIMMTPKFNLRLSVFLCASLFFTAVQILLAVFLTCDWMYYGLIQCALYDVGAIANLLNGHRTVRDVVGKK